MKFYVVQDDYIIHLKTIDERVPDNERGARTFIGIVLEVNGFNYLAPLTSPKPHHQMLTASDPRFFKLHEKGNTKNELGMIRLNNMLPLAEGTYHLLDVSKEYNSYRTLLANQIRFIASNQNKIKEKAKLLYEIVTSGKNEDLVRESCDFKALEKGCMKYTEAARKAIPPITRQSSANNLSESTENTPKIAKQILTLKRKPQVEAGSTATANKP